MVALLRPGPPAERAYRRTVHIRQNSDRQDQNLRRHRQLRRLRLPNVDAVLEGQIAAAGGRLRGIRQIAAHDPAIIGASSYVPPPGLMDDPNFRRGLKRLPARNLTFEAWIYHPQIKTLTEVARECEVKIVLNHFGGPLGVGPDKRGNPTLALQILERERPIDLLLVDYAMPEMNGRAVIDRARTCRPELKALLITGYAEALRTGGISAIPLLAKPFKVAELSRRIAEILRGSSSDDSAKGGNAVH